MRRRLAIALIGAAMWGAGCGYHVAGRSDSLPKSIHVIAVPALENKTTSYRIEQRLTTATVHEFLAKTSYRVVPDPANGDAVLRGKVLTVEAVPLLFDTATGRATAMLITLKCEITFEERETGWWRIIDGPDFATGIGGEAGERENHSRNSFAWGRSLSS